MKLKNSLAKKLIIVLIILVLFNSVYPTMSYAVDIGGILLQPIYWLLLGIYIPIDIAAGATIRLVEWAEGEIHGYTETIMQTKPSGWTRCSCKSRNHTIIVVYRP